MSRNRRFIVKHADNSISITAFPCEDDDEVSIQWWLARVNFAQSRFVLENPSLTGDALTQWRLTVKASDFTGTIPVTHDYECLASDIPSDRTFRNAWEWSD